MSGQDDRRSERWSELKAALRKRLRETGALAMFVGSVVVASGPTAGASPAAEPAEKPSITVRVKKVQRTFHEPVTGRSSDDPGATADWSDHWSNHWTKRHWTKQWTQHWSNHAL